MNDPTKCADCGLSLSDLHPHRCGVPILTEAIGLQELTPIERRYVRWLAGWDHETIDTFAGLFRRIRPDLDNEYAGDVTIDWLRSIGFGDRPLGMIGRGPLLADVHSVKQFGSELEWYLGRGAANHTIAIPAPQTRRDVADLCRLLGCPLNAPVDQSEEG